MRFHRPFKSYLHSIKSPFHHSTSHHLSLTPFLRFIFTHFVCGGFPIRQPRPSAPGNRRLRKYSRWWFYWPPVQVDATDKRSSSVNATRRREMISRFSRFPMDGNQLEQRRGGPMQHSTWCNQSNKDNNNNNNRRRRRRRRRKMAYSCAIQWEMFPRWKRSSMPHKWKKKKKKREAHWNWSINTRPNGSIQSLSGAVSPNVYNGSTLHGTSPYLPLQNVMSSRSLGIEVWCSWLCQLHQCPRQNPNSSLNQTGH